MRFWVALFCFPHGLIEALERMCRHFLLPGSLDGVKQVVVSWEAVRTLKKQGGLGYKELLSLDKALMVNWVADLASS